MLYTTVAYTRDYTRVYTITYTKGALHQGGLLQGGLHKMIYTLVYTRDYSRTYRRRDSGRAGRRSPVDVLSVVRWRLAGRRRQPGPVPGPPRRFTARAPSKFLRVASTPSDRRTVI